jgi:hypothetical protein
MRMTMAVGKFGRTIADGAGFSGAEGLTAVDRAVKL